MSESSIKRFYGRSDFVNMLTAEPNIPLLRTTLNGLALEVPIAEVRSLTGGGAVVEWEAFPDPADIVLIDAAIAAFVGGATTSAPMVLESFAALQTTDSVTPAKKAELQTPPLDGGTYTFSWNSLLRMNPAAANSGVQGIIRITRSDGVVREQPDSWDLTAPHAFNGNIIFEVSAGQTLLAEAFVLRLGAGGTAEMLGVRFTIDQLEAAAD
jgi:hypothetical protein